MARVPGSLNPLLVKLKYIVSAPDKSFSWLDWDSPLTKVECLNNSKSHEVLKGTKPVSSEMGIVKGACFFPYSDEVSSPHVSLHQLNNWRQRLEATESSAGVEAHNEELAFRK